MRRLQVRATIMTLPANTAGLCYWEQPPAAASALTATSAAMPPGSTSTARMADTVSRMPFTEPMSVTAWLASASTDSRNACKAMCGG